MEKKTEMSGACLKMNEINCANDDSASESFKSLCFFIS